MPELEAELAALQTRAADAEAEAGKLEEALQVCLPIRSWV